MDCLEVYNKYRYMDQLICDDRGWYAAISQVR